MKIFFWQNIISPHQVDFLKALSTNYEIILIVDEIQDAERQKDRWEVPHYDYLTIIISPALNALKQYFKDPQNIHVFSGISAYKTVYAGFKTAIQCKARIGILSESIKLDGIKGFLKLLRGHYHRLKYGKKIAFIATAGALGVKTYENFGYEDEKILQWGYFVNPVYENIQNKSNTIVFIGNLNANKQILPLVELFLNHNLPYKSFEIIGSGPLEEDIKAMVKDDQRIRVHGRLTNKKSLEMLAQSKLLILPSLEDGWGVAVNEALLAGTPVICSDSVGAKILIENSDRGKVFKTGDYTALQAELERSLNESPDLAYYERVQAWAKKKISPEAAAHYFSEIINYAFEEKINRKKPIAPWLKTE